MKVTVLPTGAVSVFFPTPKPHGQLFLPESETAKKLKDKLNASHQET